MHLHDLWFVLIALLWIGYFFLEGFDFGIGVLTKALARNRAERRVLINTIGPVWDGNEVWLLSAVGGTFAAFPDWYATLLSGFYLPFLLILGCLILRGVAFEYRHKRGEERWQRNWEHTTFWCSLIPAFLWGVIFADIVRGVPIGADHDYAGDLGDLVSGYALLGGFFTLALFTFHGAVFATLRTLGDVRVRARSQARVLGLLALALGAAFLIWTQADHGRGRSLVAVVIAGVALAASLLLNRRGREGWAFGLSGTAVVAAFSSLFLALFPDVMPSTLDPAWSLTVTNAASGHYTLTIMTWVALIVTPLVMSYQAFTYWVFRRRIGVQHIPGATTSAAPSPKGITMSPAHAAQPPRILIVGGGYAGLYTALRVLKKLRGDEATVTVVDPRSYMTYLPFLPEAAGGNVADRNLVAPLRPTLKKAEVVTGHVVAVDHSRKTATIVPPAGDEYELGFDHLVVATGSLPDLPHPRSRAVRHRSEDRRRSRLLAQPRALAARQGRLDHRPRGASQGPHLRLRRRRLRRCRGRR